MTLATPWHLQGQTHALSGRFASANVSVANQGRKRSEPFIEPRYDLTNNLRHRSDTFFATVKSVTSNEWDFNQ